MVRHAFRVLTEDRIPTRLLAFSDDMDGLRKVPDNVPDKALLQANLDKPLTRVPDPFGTHESFGAHNNARLRAFLDRFGFDYEFASATDYYTSGRFDAALLATLRAYERVMAIMLPTFREERAATYSPFLPIHPETGHVLQVPLEGHDAAAGTISWRDPASGELRTTPVTGGHAKLQWKPDWAMRWYALGVDYEMAGKDLIDSVKLSGQIVRALGGTPPEGFNYELFLDAGGQKISKSKGNGLTIDEWLTYASPESLALFMYQRPKEAKKLHFDVIPRNVDEYLGFLDAARRQEQAGDAKGLVGNPAWHMHGGAPPAPEMLVSASGTTAVSFAMLLNLATVANSEDPAVLWGFLRRYAPDVSPQSHPRLDALVGYAVAYYRDFVAPAKRYRAPDDVEREALTKLDAAMAGAAARRLGRGLSRPRCTMSAVPFLATRTLPPKAPRRSAQASATTSSQCCTRCFSARRRDRASARSPRSTASARLERSSRKRSQAGSRRHPPLDRDRHDKHRKLTKVSTRPVPA